MEDIVGVGRTVHERLSSPHTVSLVHTDMFPFRDQIFLGLANLRSDNDLTLTLGVFTESNHTINLGNHSELFRLTRLKEFGDSRQTTGDIFGLCRFTRNLGQDVASANR